MDQVDSPFEGNQAVLEASTTFRPEATVVSDSHMDTRDLTSPVRRLLQTVLPFVTAMPLAASSLACTEGKKIDPIVIIMPPEVTDKRISQAEIDALNKQTMEATVQVDLRGTFLHNGAPARMDGSCTGFVYDPHTIVTIRHCFGIDPRPTSVRGVATFELLPNENVKKNLIVAPLGRYRFVYSDPVLVSPDMQTTFDGNVPHNIIWDGPTGIVFQNPHFENILPLKIDDSPALNTVDPFCFGHFAGYGNEQKWAFDIGTFKVQYPPEVFIFPDRPKLILDNVVFNLNAQPGNSGGPVVNCHNKKAMSLAHGGNSGSLTGTLFTQSLGPKLESEIKKAEAEFQK